MQNIILKEVDSTNLYAKKNLEVLADKTIVQALKQNFGHGRLNREWIDLGKGNLFLSYVLKPYSEFSKNYSNLTQYLSVVLCERLDKYGLEAYIKWPNDVQVNGKKIAGILSETVMQGSEFKGLVLGIGVNLKAELNDLKKITEQKATAFNIELGREVNLEEFKSELVKAFFDNYDEFLLNGFEYIKEKYIKRANFLNKLVKVETIQGIKQGLVKSVNDLGELVLDNEGKEFVITTGDVYIIERE